jgi:transcriptional antiterminator RfaH
MDQSPEDAMIPWYAVMTKPGAEDRVAEQIRTRLERDVYVPHIEIQVKRGRKLTPAIRPLFPHYLFARLHMPQEWRLITFTRGSLRVLGGWQDPQPVAEEIVEIIRSRERDEDRVIQYYNFKTDDRVYVKHGPLRELYGIFERYVDDQGRVKVLLALLNYQASVVLDACYLEKA